MLLAVSTLLFGLAIARSPECPTDKAGLGSCIERDRPLTGLTGTLKHLASCRAVYANPNAITVCREYKEVADACPCVCLLAVCEWKELVNDEVEKDLSEFDELDFKTPEQGCFHGSGMVKTSKGPITIQDLSSHPNIDVEVLKDDGSVGLEKIDYWFHHDDKQDAGYVTVATESNHKIKMTYTHLVFRTSCVSEDQVRRIAMLAISIKPGDCILVRTTDGLRPSKVKSVRESRDTGVYAFGTHSGTVIVNGVAASNFALLENDKSASFLFKAISTLKKALPGKYDKSLFGNPVSDHIVKLLHTFNSKDL